MKKRPTRGTADDAQMRVRSSAPADSEPAAADFLNREGPRDECGVFGIYAPELDVSRLAYFALYALQHRGQESAGIATGERGHITTQRELGLVSQVFDERSLQALTGDMAIGHVRYSTTGASGWENSQPVYRHDRRPVALAHNGNLINAVELYNELTAPGRPVPLHLRLGDHRGADRLPSGGAHRGRRRRRDEAPARRLLDRDHDRPLRGRVPRPGRSAPALPGPARRPLRGRLRELRARHHRRAAAARGPARAS